MHICENSLLKSAMGYVISFGVLLSQFHQISQRGTGEIRVRNTHISFQ